MATQYDFEAALNTLARTLRSARDIKRGIRLDKAIANDGTIIPDQVVGLLKLIENVDAVNQGLSEVTINLTEELVRMLGVLNDPITGTFVFDDFRDTDGTSLTDHTGNLNASWESDGGSFSIVDERVYGTSTGFVLASGTPPVPDYKVEAEFTYFTDSGENAIAARIQPGENTGYYLYYNSGAFHLVRQVAGTGTELKSITYSSSNLPVTATLAVSGSQIDVFVDRVAMATVTDTAIPELGRVGMRSRPVTTTTGQHLDNFRASAYVAQINNLQGLISALDSALNDEDAPDDSPPDVDLLNTTLRNVLGNKRDKDTDIPKSDITGLEDDLTTIDNSLSNKRDKNVDIPQEDVTGLSAKLTTIDNSLSNKRDKSVAIPQADVSGLTSALSSVTGNITVLTERDQIKKKTATQTISSTSLVDVSTLIFTLPANSEWMYECYLDFFLLGSTDGTFNGIQFALSVPSGATFEGTYSGETSTGTPHFEAIDPLFSSQPFLTSGQPGRISINANIDIGSTSGQVKVRAAVADSPDTAVIAKSSFARIRRTDA